MSSAVYVSYLMGGKQEFGRWLDRALREAGMTPAQLSRAAGVSQGQLTRYRQGETLPDTPTITRIAEALSVDADELLIIAGHRQGDHDEDPAFVIRTKNRGILRIAKILDKKADSNEADIAKAEALIETLFGDDE